METKGPRSSASYGRDRRNIIPGNRRVELGKTGPTGRVE